MTTNRTSLERIVNLGFLKQEHVAQLRTAKIKDGLQLVAAWHTPAERQRVSRAVDLPMPKLMRAVFAANLLSQSAPGVAGIDELLKHQEDLIRDFNDTESDHKFVCQNRQGILQYAGQTVYENWVYSNKYQSVSKQNSYAWLFILAYLISLGIILYSHWDALFGRLGPDVTSQLSQALDRGEAIKQAIVVVYVSVSGTFFLISFSLINKMVAWFETIIDRMMVRTPRDVLVLVDAQKHTHPVWVKINQFLNRMGKYIWAILMLVGFFIPGSRNWIDWWIFVFAFSWIFLKIKGVSVRFSQIGAAWAEQARPRQAGLLLIKMITAFLTSGIHVMIICLIILFLQKDANIRIQAHVQATRSDLHSWLAQQTLKKTDPSIGELEKLTWDTTQTWLGTSLKNNEDWTAFLGILHLFSVLMFSTSCGAVFGWFYFIRYKRWFKMFIGFAVVYLVLEIAPDLVTLWLSITAQTNYQIWQAFADIFLIFQKVVINNMPGLIIGLFFALGQEVFNSANDHELNHECPNCHLLHVAPCCEFERIDTWDQEFPLDVK